MRLLTIPSLEPSHTTNVDTCMVLDNRSSYSNMVKCIRVGLLQRLFTNHQRQIWSTSARDALNLNIWFAGKPDSEWGNFGHDLIGSFTWFAGKPLDHLG